MKPLNLFLLIIGLLTLVLGVAWYMDRERLQQPAHDYAATVQQECAPWDGAAFSVKISLGNNDSLDIVIWEAPTIPSEKTFSFLEEPSQAGYANLVHSTGSGEQLIGKVSFTSVEPGSPVEGKFELETVDPGQHFAGQFMLSGSSNLCCVAK